MILAIALVLFASDDAGVIKTVRNAAVNKHPKGNLYKRINILVKGSKKNI